MSISQLIITSICVTVVLFYRRVVKKRLQVQSYKRTIIELKDIYIRYENLLASKEKSEKDMDKIFGEKKNTKYRIDICFYKIKFSSIEELRKGISDFCIELQLETELLEKLYNQYLFSEEYEKIIKNIILSVRRLMWKNNESWTPN